MTRSSIRVKICALSALLCLASGIANAQSEGFLGDVDRASGLFVHNTPIEVPNYFDIEPELSFGYQSTMVEGPLGTGWILGGVDIIRRFDSFGLGAPNYTATIGAPEYTPGGTDTLKIADVFIVPCEVGSESPSCKGGGNHRTDPESFQRMKLQGDTWTIWHKNGTQFTLIPIHKVGSGTIIAWGLSKVRDTVGHEVNYIWSTCPGGTDCDPLLDKIEYNNVQIDFVYEDRRVAVERLINRGDEIRLLEKRLKTVDVRVDAGGVGLTTARSYNLIYASSSGSGGRETIAQIRQYGSDHGALKPASISYLKTAFTYNDTTETSLDIQTGGGGQDELLFDMEGWSESNSDFQILAGDFIGYSHADDMVVIKAEGDAQSPFATGFGISHYSCDLDETTVPAETAERLHLLKSTETELGTEDLNVLTGDFDGDGRQDITVIHKPSSSGSWWYNNVSVELSGDCVFDSDSWTTFTPGLAGLWNGGGVSYGEHASYRFLPGDYNSDGLTDIAIIRVDSDPLWQNNIAVAVSNGSGFHIEQWRSPLAGRIHRGGGGLKNYRVAATDMNGDGVADIFAAGLGLGAWEHSFFVALTSSASFATIPWASDTARRMRASGGELFDYAMVLGDLNGDGATDISTLSTKWNTVSVEKSTGLGFRSSTQLADTATEMFNDGETWEYRILGGDLNGDGLGDILAFKKASSGLWSDHTFAEFSNGDGLVSHSNENDFVKYLRDHDEEIYEYSIVPKFTNTMSIWALNPHHTLQENPYYDEWWFVPSFSGLYVDFGAPGLMRTAYNDFGGSIEVDYSLASRVVRTEYQLPRYWLVKQIRSFFAPFHEPSSTKDITYYGGRFEFETRRFLGYDRIVEELGGSSAEPGYYWRESRLNNDGDLLSTTLCDNLAVFYRYSWANGWCEEVKFTYGAYSPMPLAELNAGPDDEPYSEGTIAAKEITITHADYSKSSTKSSSTKTYFFYDTYGNVVKEVTTLSDAPPGSRIVTKSDYFHNDTAYVVDKPALVTTFAVPQGQIIQNTVNLYDYAELGQWNSPPTLGQLTKVGQYLNYDLEQLEKGQGLFGLDSVPQYVFTEYNYDPIQGNLLEEITPSGAVKRFTYAAPDYINPRTMQWFDKDDVPLSLQTTTEWNPACHKVTMQIDENGERTDTDYDKFCRLARVTKNLGQPEEWYSATTFSSTGTLNQYATIETLGPSGRPFHQRIYYDGLGRTWREASSGPDAERLWTIKDTFYNNSGKVRKQGKPMFIGEDPYYVSRGPSEMEFEVTTYDFLGRVVSRRGERTVDVMYEIGKRTVTEGSDTVVEEFDPMGNMVKRSETSLEPNSGVEKTSVSLYTHDASGRVLTHRDPDLNYWAWFYDSLGRKLAMLHPDSGMLYFGYDDAGHQTFRRDQKGQWVEQDYDILGRKSEKRTYRANGTEESRSEFYYGELGTCLAKNTCGRLKEMVDEIGNVVYSYNNQGKMSQAIRYRNDVPGKEYKMRYGYYPTGHVKWTEYPDGDEVGQEGTSRSGWVNYDNSGRIRRIPGILLDADYDARGRLTYLKNANNTETTRLFEDGPQVTFIDTVNGSGDLLQNTSISYSDGKIAREQSLFKDQSYLYYNGQLATVMDWNNNQVSQYTYSNGANLQKVERFASACIGNPQCLLEQKDLDYDRPYTPHAVSRASQSGLFYTEDTNIDYDYDANGNMISRRGVGPEGSTAVVITYDVENRPIIFEKNGVETHFVYDGFGQRFIKRTEGGSETVYIGSAYEETDSVTTKHITVGGLLIAKRVIDPGTSSGTSSSPSTYALHTDPRGSIEAITDANGDLVEEVEYSPWGEVLAKGDEHDQSRLFAGQEYDDETGLVYMHARYYDPWLHRFVTPDPAMRGYAHAALNPYAYAGNDPINRIDPDGQGFLDWFVDMFRSVAKFADKIRNSIPVIGPAIASVITYFAGCYAGIFTFYDAWGKFNSMDWRAFGTAAVNMWASLASAGLASAGVGPLIGALGNAAIDIGRQTIVAAINGANFGRALVHTLKGSWKSMLYKYGQTIAAGALRAILGLGLKDMPYTTSVGPVELEIGERTVKISVLGTRIPLPGDDVASGAVKAGMSTLAGDGPYIPSPSSGDNASAGSAPGGGSSPSKLRSQHRTFNARSYSTADPESAGNNSTAGAGTRGHADLTAGPDGFSMFGVNSGVAVQPAF